MMSILRKAGLLACFFALSACAGDPVTVYKPVSVDVPISTPCKVPVIERPASPVDNLLANAPMFDRVRALLADRELRISYETQLEAAAKACE
jgi:hypothetical protein